MLATNLLVFNHPGQPHHIPHWREDINAIAHEHSHLFEATGLPMNLFHNSGADGGKLLRYPRIQYRVHQGRLALWGIGPGATALHLLAGLLHGQVLRMQPGYAEITKTEAPQHYRLYHWLALDKKNFDAYNTLPQFGKRVALLQDLLQTHLRFFLEEMAPQKGSPWRKLLIREITAVNDGQRVRFHDKGGSETVHQKWKAFSLVFSVPLMLPYEMALGNKVSLGFGRLQPLPLLSGAATTIGEQ